MIKYISRLQVKTFVNEVNNLKYNEVNLQE